MNSTNQDIYEFGPFQLDVANRSLRREGQPVSLAPKALDMLILLVRHQGQVLEKDHFMELLWPDSVVEEANLPLNVSALRKALGESPSERKYIVTIPGKGYKFAAQVRQAQSEDGTVVISRFSRARVVVEERVDSSPEEVGSTAGVFLEAGSPRARRTWTPIQLILGGALVLAIGLFSWLFLRTKYVATKPIPSLAVLPFKALAEGGDDALEIGLADVLITRLSSLQEVTVRPTSAVLKYLTNNKGAVEIGKELGVQSVLEGSVQRSNGTMRVTVRLIHVDDGTTLWADKFDTPSTDIFTIEDTISERVAERLALRLRPEEKDALAKHDTENTDAHFSYLKGRYQLEKRTPDAAKRAIEFFEQAIREDPKYALSYAGIAEGYVSRAVTGGMLPNEAFPRGREAATKALVIDPQLADAYTMLAVAEFWHDWDYAAAERHFKRAIEINPNHLRAHQMYGHLLSNLGKHEEGLKEIGRALEIDPMSLISNAVRGQMLIFASQPEEAISHLTKSLDVEPNFWISHLVLGKAYGRKGMYSEAIAEFERAWELSDHSGEPKSYLGYTYAVSGKRGDAVAAISQLKQMSLERYIAPKHIALVYAGLGERDAMFEWLEKAYEGRDISLSFIKVEPRWDPYRSDPRFVDLMRRVGF